MKSSKTCRKCKEVKDESQFYNTGHVTLAGKGIKDTLCKTCKKAYKRGRQDKLKSWVNNHKKLMGCEKCGYSIETHPSFSTSALQFHHPQNNKEFAIGDGIRLGVSIETIEKEINKCVLLCSRCHAEIHSNARHNL